MQPGRARTSSLGAPPLLLAQLVGWVAAVRRTDGVWFVVARPSIAFGANMCAVSWSTWLLFTGVPARCVVSRVLCPEPLSTCSPVCLLGALSCVCGDLGHLAPVHRCVRSVLCVVGAVSRATWLLFTSVPARCVVLPVRCPGPLGSCSPVCPLVVCAASSATWLLCSSVLARCFVLCVRCPQPLGSCSPLCPLGGLCRVCGLPGHLAPVQRCVGSVPCVACAVSQATLLLFTGVLARCVVLYTQCPGPLGSCAPVCWLGALCCVCSVLGHLASVHRCGRSVYCVACAVSWATWLLFTGVIARCCILCVRCPGPPGSCSPVCLLGGLCRVCGVLGHFAPVLGVPARCVVSPVRCPGPLGSCSPVCSPTALCSVCGVLGLLTPVHRCACSMCCVVCVRCPGPLGSCSPVCPLGVFCRVHGVVGPLAPVHRCAPLVRCVVCVLCPWPLGSCSPVCPLDALSCVRGVLGHLAPTHRCAHSVCCLACAVSWATWLLFIGLLARHLVLRVQCPGQLGSCSLLCSLGALCCVCCVLGHLAPFHRCARSVCCLVCAVSWATWLLFTGVPARFAVLRARCPEPLGSCSPVCLPAALCSVCGALGLLTPVHRCACSMCCVVCVRCPGPLGSCSPVCSPAALCSVCGVLGLLTPVHRCACSMCCVVCVRCPGPLGSCSPVCPLGVFCRVHGVVGPLAPVHRCAPLVRCIVCVLCPWPLGSCSPVCPLDALSCVRGVLGHLAPTHRCAHSVCCLACAVSWATWLLFIGLLARHLVLRVQCPGQLGSCSLLCSLGALCCVCCVLGHLAPFHRCARSVCCLVCAVSWATWLLFTGVPARFAVLRARCPEPLGSCSPVCLPGAWCCVCGVLGHLAPVHPCVCWVCCVVCALPWATCLLSTGVPARCAVVRAQCPGQLGFCSRVCFLAAPCCVCDVLGHFTPAHRCVRLRFCVLCAVSWATWLLFTGVPARCVVLRVWCPGRPGSCAPVCSLGVLCCVCGVLGHLAPVHQCAPSVCCALCCVCGVACSGFAAGRAIVNPDGGCFVAGKGWLPSRAHTSIRTAAVS